MSNLSLFSEPEDESSPRAKLAAKLAELARRNIWIGTSSWKYEGWLGDIYTPERYMTRGKHSKKKFDDTCLAEYAETFPIVCGDFSFYQFPSDDYWRKLFGSAPHSLRFAFKVPEEITVKRWPGHARYGARAQTANEAFLNPAIFERMFLEPLDAYGERVALMVFEFGSFAKSDFESVERFVETLDVFLDALPPRRRYAVEIRNREYLDQPYFDCLRRHGVAHVYNAWTRMPELSEQIAIPGAATADFTVVRALLRAGRKYEYAVDKFSPYQVVQDPNPEARDAIRDLIRQASSAGRPAFVFVNNRLEGNAPTTIRAVVED